MKNIYSKLNDLKRQHADTEISIINNIGTTHYKTVCQNDELKYNINLWIIYNKAKDSISETDLDKLRLYISEFPTFTDVKKVISLANSFIDLIGNQNKAILGDWYDLYYTDLFKIKAEIVALKFQLNGSYGVFTK